MITISIVNDDTRDLFVQVWDLNQPGNPQVMNARINQGSRELLQVQEDSDGKGQINWTVADANDPLTGHSTSSPVTPTVGEEVNVDVSSTQ
jgi:hypothetical protein